MLGKSDSSSIGTKQGEKLDKQGDEADDKTEHAARVTYSEALQDMCHAREFICKYHLRKQENE